MILPLHICQPEIEMEESQMFINIYKHFMFKNVYKCFTNISFLKTINESFTTKEKYNTFMTKITDSLFN